MIFAAAVAILVFWGCATLSAALFGAVDGRLPAVGVWIALAVGLAAAVPAFRASRRAPGPPPARAWDRVALVLFGLVSVRHFAFLLYESRGSYWTPDAYNYGDLPLHWTYISNFARDPRFWPENPVFTGTRLQYPFGMDLLTALLVRLGLPMALAVCAVGLAGAVLLGCALWRWGGGFAIAAVLFSGGLGPDVAWKNLFLALFVPQRGFLFALPAGLFLLWSWRERLLRGGRALPAWIEGALWGAMPLFHVHTFLFLSLLFAGWTFATGRWKAALPALGWALLPATWGIVEVTDVFRAAALVWWKPGWVMANAPSAPLFMAVNFTLFLPLFAWSAAEAVRRRDAEGLETVLPGLVLWGGLFFVMLAPWDWDNTKVMIWCYLLVLPATWRLTLGRLPLVARAAAVALLLAPGGVAVAASLVPGRAFALGRVDEVEGVCAAVRKLPVDARVATAQTFNHPVALCGQPIVAGYPGHLWSHGIAAASVEAGLRRLMLGEGGWRASARRLSARYVFWGWREMRDYAGSTRPWEGEAPVYSGEWGRLYVIDPAAPTTGDAD